MPSAFSVPHILHTVLHRPVPPRPKNSRGSPAQRSVAGSAPSDGPERDRPENAENGLSEFFARLRPERSPISAGSSGWFRTQRKRRDPNTVDSPCRTKRKAGRQIASVSVYKVSASPSFPHAGPSRRSDRKNTACPGRIPATGHPPKTERRNYKDTKPLRTERLCRTAESGTSERHTSFRRGRRNGSPRTSPFRNRGPALPTRPAPIRRDGNDRPQKKNGNGPQAIPVSENPISGITTSDRRRRAPCRLRCR